MALLSRRVPIGGPLLSVLGAFPLALLSAALVTDIAYARSAQPQWSNLSVWLIAGGCLTGGLAALVAIVRAVARRRRGPALHGVLLVAAFVTAVINGFVHSRDGWTAVVPDGLALSAVTTVLVLVVGCWSYAMIAAPARGDRR